MKVEFTYNDGELVVPEKSIENLISCQIQNKYF